MTMDADAAQALREPFPAGMVGKLPKPTRKDNPRANCSECGGYHGMPAVHLDYVGHAATTDRLIKVDPCWTWEPLALDERGLPAYDRDGGLWIKLTILGVTRLGYGDGTSIKEMIGDCLVTGTPVVTGRGTVPIEAVRPGDIVPTRQGWREVTDHWLSHASAPVVAVLLDDGSSLVGTPHHRVPTTEGPSHMGTLRNGAMLYAWQDTDASLAASNWSGTDAATAGTLRPSSATTGSTGSPPHHPAPTSTGTSTKPSTAPSPPVGTSTTPTATRSTTAPGTSLRSTVPPTPSTTTPSESGGRTPATSVAPSSPAASSPTTCGGARRPARNGGGDARGWRPVGPGRAPSPRIVSATSVAPGSLLASLGPGSALRRVVAVLDAGVAPVWNLSVDGVHEYVAGGVFVHNSIRNAAMRFGVALDLWAKEDLHAEPAKTPMTASQQTEIAEVIAGLADDEAAELKAWWKREGLPKMERLSRDEAAVVLDRMEHLPAPEETP